MAENGYRVERDSMGELQVPKQALWGAQTQRAVENFPISGLAMPRAFIRALGLIKWAAAGANGELALLPTARRSAIQAAALEVAEGRHDQQFPVDVFQTGSGTSSNMNANEVIAHLASKRGRPRFTRMTTSTWARAATTSFRPPFMSAPRWLLPRNCCRHLKHLQEALEAKAHETDDVVKTGRTHLMDAMPVRLGQELSGLGQPDRPGAARG